MQLIDIKTVRRYKSLRVRATYHPVWSDTAFLLVTCMIPTNKDSDS